MISVFCACSWAVAANGYMSPSCAHAGGQESSSLHKGPAYSKLSQNVLVVPVLAVIPPFCAISPSPPLPPSWIPCPISMDTSSHPTFSLGEMFTHGDTVSSNKWCETVSAKASLILSFSISSHFFSPPHAIIFFFKSLCDKAVGQLRMSHCWHHMNDCNVAFCCRFHEQSQGFCVTHSAPPVKSAMVSVLHWSWTMTLHGVLSCQLELSQCVPVTCVCLSCQHELFF